MLKKERRKGFILGFVTAIFSVFILTFSTSAFAASVKQSIQVLYNNIQLVVNGEKVQLGKDSKGKRIEPFIYNGTTYLPIRAVGEALGERVYWDGKTKTVYIGKRNDFEADKLLSDLDYFSSGQQYIWGSGDWENYSRNQITKWPDGKKDNEGNVYNNGLHFKLLGAGTGATYGLSAYQEYILDGKYRKFQGRFVLDYNSRSNNWANATLYVYGDDRLIYQSKPMQKGVRPIDFTIDVSGVNKLKIEVRNDSNFNRGMSISDSVEFGIVNAGFFK